MYFDWLTLHILSPVENVFGWVIGQQAGSTYLLTRWIVLRGIALIYLIAFISLWVQIRGLIGSQGILPVQDFLAAMRTYLGGVSFKMLPTVFWFNASDAALTAVCALGVLFSILALLGVMPIGSFVILWVLYLSLTVAGQDFLSFQWDILLLEAGFLAIFLSPWRFLPGLSGDTIVSPLLLFLVWWLAFRLSFESGIVKLLSGDHTWRDLTALDYHYWTQPLPTWTAWYAAQLPMWFHKLSVVLMYILEIGFPFLMFGPRPLRLASAGGMILLQIIILATGNYTFFNFLTIILCFGLIDDRFWLSVLPQRAVEWIGSPIGMPAPVLWSVCVVVVGLIILFVSTVKLLESFSERAPVPPFLDAAITMIEPFRSVNAYGLFRVMTTDRQELIIEGSDDGKKWMQYELPWKPGNPKHAPGFVEPHQPRLDWQLWFAAMGTFESEPWVKNVLIRLLQGSPDVNALFAENPFPLHPPKYIRVMRYMYRFTTPEEGRVTGEWWHRELQGEWSPALSLK